MPGVASRAPLVKAPAWALHTRSLSLCPSLHPVSGPRIAAGVWGPLASPCCPPPPFEITPYFKLGTPQPELEARSIAAGQWDLGFFRDVEGRGNRAWDLGGVLGHGSSCLCSSSYREAEAELLEVQGCVGYRMSSSSAWTAE